MDERQNSIIAQTCIKASCELLAGRTLGEVLEAATTLEAWVHEADLRWTSEAPKGQVQVPRPAAVPSGCPKCGDQMWDNRFDKKNPKSPDFKCKNKACAHPIWLTPASEKPPF